MECKTYNLKEKNMYYLLRRMRIGINNIFVDFFFLNMKAMFMKI